MNKPCIAMVFLLFVAGNDCSVTDNTVVSTGCKGENLTIYWEYSDAGNMNSVTWEFISGSTTTLILVQGATGAAAVQNNFNVEHINNGEIKLTDLTAANVGTYKITVAYSTTPSASDTFEVTAIHDAPTGLSYTDVGSVVTCSATSLGSPAAQLYLKVDGTDTGLTSDTIDEGSGKAVECCLKGDSIECMTTSPCVTVRSKTPGKKCWCLVKCDIPVCVICWIIIIIVVEFIIGAILGCFMYCNGGRYDCFNTDGQLPRFFKILAFSFIFSAVALGIYVVWRCIGRQGNEDVEPRVRTPRNETQSGNPHTDQKKSETKKNKSKDSNEQHNQGRKQPPPPSDAGAAAGTTLNGREDSDGAVSREHVDLQESGRTLPQRPMPGIPRKNDGQGHDSKGRGLSANFNDDDHPLIGIDIPSKKAGALGSLSEETGGEGPVKKLKKKKRKSKEDQEDEV